METVDPLVALMFCFAGLLATSPIWMPILYILHIRGSGGGGGGYGDEWCADPTCATGACHPDASKPCDAIGE